MPPVPPKHEDTPRPRPDRSRDKALLIAIEYKWPIHGSVEVLDSPHSDLFKMRNHLVEDWHYHSDNIVILKDGPENEVDPDMIPTRNNIVRMSLLIADDNEYLTPVYYSCGRSTVLCTTSRQGIVVCSFVRVIMTYECPIDIFPSLP